ncbi:MAG: hypothetical protein H7A31_02795 [Thermotogae bacterium]|nr:hypothetical protein [Thermotogota bacterium]MCP5465602.1 hypothetical protein [Thermotogota bacterium]HOO74152.1 hypothetical protein [Tepiditoga sp.]
MANEIIETYRLLQERINSENAKVFFEMLDSPYPAFRSRAITELMKLKIDTPAVKSMLKDSDQNVRLSALRYMEKMGLMDENEISESIKDISSAVRRDAVRIYISGGYEPLERITQYIKDPDPSVRYQFLISMLEFYPEDSEKIINQMREDPFIKIRHLIEAIENLSDTLKNPEIENSIKKIALIRSYESNDTMTFFNIIKNNYHEFNKQTKVLVIRFLGGLPCEIIKGFIENKLNDEKDEEIIYEFSKVIRKVCGLESIPSWITDNFIKSSNSVIMAMGFKLAAEKDDMGYVDYARELLDAIEDEIVIAASNYLAFFQDFTLSDYITKFLGSLSSKRVNAGLKIIRKLKMENFTSEIITIINNKYYPVTIRKNALNVIKYFKKTEYWEIPYNILKDPSERSDLKLVSLNTLLKLNPEMVTNL